MKIKDLKEEGKVSLLCLITKCEKGRTQKNTPYLSLTLQDSTGLLDAKFWNLSEEMVSRYAPGQVVKAQGELIYHKNAAQLKVQKLIPAPEENLSDYVLKAPMSRQEMEQVVDEMIASIQDGDIKAIVQQIVNDRREEYFTYPAAVRNHHNFAGGLAYHSITMAKAARMLRALYPYLDYDLLIGGILLHDAGKIDEYTQAILPEYSMAGNLLGHISMMSSEIDQAARARGAEKKEKVILLRHMVLSHHGKMEFGSPVLPMIPEAEMLADLDNMDARLYMMKNAVDITQPGSFAPRNFALENRMVYHAKEKE